MLQLASLIAAVAPIIGMASATPSGKQISGYIYDGVGRADKLSIVIDASKYSARIEGTARASIATSDSEVVRDYDDCGNDAFYCATGMIEIVIPKAMPMEHWTYHGLSCRSVSQPVGDTYRISCRSPQYRGQPTYTYSISHGVVSIESSPIGGDHRYELRGKRGLFSLED